MFEELELARPLQLGLLELQLTAPTEVQSRALPEALAGRDVLLSAPTGSGKTLAYLLPVAQRLLATTHKPGAGTLALVLVPTRELARQVVAQARKLLCKSPLHVLAITGGADSRYQRALLRQDPEIVVATPGRLLELAADGGAKLDLVESLVLDEADRLLDLGFREDVLAIAGRTGPARQTIMLSATLEHRGVAAVARELLRDPVTIAIGTARQAHDAIAHQAILADGTEHKDKLLPALLQADDWQRALVFANTRRTAQRLANLLAGAGLRASALHGEMTTEQRKHVMARYRDGAIDILCASDVAARGLDVRDITLVINYDLPHSGDDYIHRSGRTGRAGDTGTAVSLIEAGEWNRMISIQRYLQLEFERRTLPGLKARYHGPKKQKSSGKAAGPKKKRRNSAAKTRRPDAARRKKPARPRRRGESSPTTAGQGNDGFAPLTRRKPQR